MFLELTAVFRKVSEGYIGFVEKLSGANTQGATLEQARANLKEAVALVIEANRALSHEDAGPDTIREPSRSPLEASRPRSPSRAARLRTASRGRQPHHLRQSIREEDVNRPKAQRDYNELAKKICRDLQTPQPNV